jgi:ribosomal protein L7Ae-like RNA K-turn-binding protein
MEKISSVLIQKNEVSVFAKDSRNIEIVQASNKLKNVLLCEDSDLILTKIEITTLCNEKVIVFATNYLAFVKSPNAIGAFFYQKGRPNIIFREENLKKHNIVLPKEFEKYIE